MTVTILLADDHHILRQGLRALIGKQRGLRVVGQTGDGLEVLDLVDKHQPDVLLLDINMPGLDGLEVARRVRAEHPSTRIVMLTVHKDEDHALRAMKNGANAYIVKDLDMSDLVKGIREAMAGHRYVSPAVCPGGMDAFWRRVERSGPDDPYETLTDREREVLHLVAEGLTSAEVAARLSIKERTADEHRGRVMHKLGLRSQGELMRYALRRGVVSLD